MQQSGMLEIQKGYLLGGCKIQPTRSPQSATETANYGGFVKAGTNGEEWPRQRITLIGE